MWPTRTVVVNGVFDVLHTGHLNLLSRAKNLGDYVVVFIDSDRRVKELKGKDRPVNNQYERLRMLSSLRTVDEVWIFESDEDLSRRIWLIHPAYMVKGADYRGKIAIGQQWCDKIEYVELNDKSTTSIVNR